MAAKSDSLDDDLVTVRDKTVRLPILHSGSVDDKVFFGPITEREKRARHLFQQRYYMKFTRNTRFSLFQHSTPLCCQIG